MTDADYSRAYWLFADKQEDDLQSYIYSLDISDIITQVFNRFAGVDLNKMLSMQQVIKLHRNIEKWLYNGLDERQYKLILHDIKARKKIKEREALMVWLLAAFCGYYENVIEESSKMYYKIATDSYKNIFKEAQKVTNKGNPKPPTPDGIDAMLKEINPSLRRTITEQLWIESQYNSQTLLAKYNSDILAGKKFDPETPENRRKFKSIEDKLLKSSTSTVNEPNGHHGIIDQQMTFITGHTVIQAMRDAGIKKVKFIATIDERTTHACQCLHLKIFDIDQLKLGVNAPPISIDKNGLPIPHPCRSFLRVIAYGAKEIENVIRSSGGGRQSKPHTFRQLGAIDINDEKAVQLLLEAFQEHYVNSKIEHCLVIATNGDVFQVDGDETSADTSLLGDRMNGSINIHNHPNDKTQYSFSYEDITSFGQDGSQIMRAFDYKYIYEIKRGNAEIDSETIDSEFSLAWNNRIKLMAQKNIPLEQFEFEQAHTVIESLCKSFGISYRRWSNGQ